MNLRIWHDVLYFCRDFLVQYGVDWDGKPTIVWEFPRQPLEGEVPFFMTLFIPVRNNLSNVKSLYFRLEFPKDKVRIEDFSSIYWLWMENFKVKLIERIWSESSIRILKERFAQSFGIYVGFWLHYTTSRLMGKSSPVVHIIADYRRPPLSGHILIEDYPDMKKNCITILLCPDIYYPVFTEHFLFWFKMSGDPQEDTLKLSRIYNSVKDHVMSYPRANFLILTVPFFEQLIKECWRYSYNMIEPVKREVDEIVRRSGRDFDETIKALTEDYKIHFFTPDTERNEKSDLAITLHLYSPLTPYHPYLKLVGIPHLSPFDKSRSDVYSALKSDSERFFFTFETNDLSVLDDFKPLFSGEPKEIAQNFYLKVSLLPELYKPDRHTQRSLLEFEDFINKRFSSSEG